MLLECLWLVTLKTSEIEGAYSDNTAFITLYGETGKTSEYHLGVPPHARAYFKGSTNEVEVQMDNANWLSFFYLLMILWDIHLFIYVDLLRLFLYNNKTNQTLSYPYLRNTYSGKQLQLVARGSSPL